MIVILWSDNRQVPTFRCISADMKISISSIHSILNRKSPQRKKKTDPKRKLDKKDCVSTRRTVNAGVIETKRVSSADIVKDTQLSVSPLTVRRYLHQVGIVYKKSRQQIALSKRHRLLRKEDIIGWIREHIDWSKVVFSDGKRFRQDGPENWRSFVPKNVLI